VIGYVRAAPDIEFQRKFPIQNSITKSKLQTLTIIHKFILKGWGEERFYFSRFILKGWGEERFYFSRFILKGWGEERFYLSRFMLNNITN
jgi:hypothetical protein